MHLNILTSILYKFYGEYLSKNLARILLKKLLSDLIVKRKEKEIANLN
jgi:hypothetical protein